ncbi:MAG: hypothetical protein V7K27_18435, partial [Nostoc sp.]|uniref:hypothetical protein n=1 Tax=Nostoc sp. TaxID=1180 RepID=UPI002FFD0A80
IQNSESIKKNSEARIQNSESIKKNSEARIQNSESIKKNSEARIQNQYNIAMSTVVTERGVVRATPTLVWMQYTRYA